ncbi:MAG TPA: DUF1576 domain-containing protein [Synergistales bacterium]|nr:DUF1576 domain-containing protein [Synergistales bacterium]
MSVYLPSRREWLSPYLFLFSFSFLMVITGFLMTPSLELMKGLLLIIEDPDYLISDYIGVGGMGAAFFNSGALSLMITILFLTQKTRITGISVASIFTVAGFGFLGKNIFNIWFIISGVYLFSLFSREKFSKYVYVAVFGTALSPLVSQLMFGISAPLMVRIIVASLTGLSIGFILPTLASQMLKVHHGFNLYNLGFVSGVVGTVYVSLFRSYGFLTESRMIWTTGNNGILGVFLVLLFSLMIITAIGIGKKGLMASQVSIWQYSGRLITDFIALEGWGPTLFNMGIMGIFSSFYIIAVRGDLNGPTLAGIFTLVGFSAFGKHLRNTIPILLGVGLGALTKSWAITDPAIQLAALFGTTLAPVSGEFGWKSGVLAGFIHSSVVLNVGVLHSGFNLYNNGFAGGIVAMVLVPLLEVIIRRDST